ncbi:hypothetical protein [Flavobacterium sp.]|uniref:hypothetical protein n=1 Tax=Flavobacterium sp. TaxID=239 RepID=UPI003A91FFB2
MKEKAVLQNTLKVLDELKYGYDKSQEALDSMRPVYHENERIYTGEILNVFRISFFMTYDLRLALDDLRHIIINAETLKPLYIITEHGYELIKYDSNESAKKVSFISPTFL